jgi:pilus assembly protein FimV
VTTTPVTTAKTTTQTLPPSTPTWYDQAWVKPAAIGAAALLLLAGLLSMRRRKAAAAAVERGSIAGAFGDSPLRDDGGAAIAESGEEQALRDQLEHDPANLGLHLELLSLLYAERNVSAFEYAAETMHMHVTDPHQPEWLETKAMGQELAPHNALFSDGAAAMSAYDDEAITARHATATPFDHDDVFAQHFDEPVAPHDEPLMPPPATTHANTAFDFDLDAAPAPKATSAIEPPFAFDNLPPIDFGKEAQHEFEAAAPAPAPLSVDEDEFAGEDGVGTKLDLAKAYLDMGDPEGARSMLEEVLSEGNDSQKGEARRLMAEIR